MIHDSNFFFQNKTNQRMPWWGKDPISRVDFLCKPCLYSMYKTIRTYIYNIYIYSIIFCGRYIGLVF